MKNNKICALKQNLKEFHAINKQDSFKNIICKHQLLKSAEKKEKHVFVY